MAKSTVKILRAFYKKQEEESRTAATADNDAEVIEEILREPNPGVVRAKKMGLPITVAKGNKIYKKNADDTLVEIGTISHEDVPVSQRRYSLR